MIILLKQSIQDEGFLSPGSDIILKINFTPTRVAPDIRYPRIACHVEGLVTPLFLTLVGSCVPQSENEVLMFKVLKILLITNPFFTDLFLDSSEKTTNQSYINQ